MNDIEQNKTIFKDIVSKTISRPGIDNLMQWLDTTDFYVAPSSARYHGAEPGGLCAHSIGVFKRLSELQDDETNETIAIAALFHDLCKVNYYRVSERNTKDETGKWIKVPYYEYNDTYPLGHGEKSVIMLMKFIQLTDDEIMAIRWHMGGFMSQNVGESQAIAAAMEKYRLVIKLQTADQQSAFWDCR